MVTLQDLGLYEGQVVYAIDRGKEDSYKQLRLYVILSDREQQDYDLPEMVDISEQVANLMGLSLNPQGYLMLWVTGELLIQAVSQRLFSRDDALRYREL